MTAAPRRIPSRHLAALAVQFGSFVIILGIPDGLLGVLWPSMRRGLHRPLADLGELVLAGTVLYLAGGLVGDRVRRRLGFRATLLWSTIVGLGSLVAWAAAPSWWLILVALAVLGLVKGVLDAVLNAAAAVDGGVRRLGLLHASWAIGGTLGPVIVAALVAGGQWRIAVVVVACAAAVLVPLAALPEQAAPADVLVNADVAATADAAVAANADLAATADPAGARGGVPHVAGVEAAHRRRQWVGIGATALAFIAYTAAESGPVSWGTTYLVSDRHFATATAAGAMAVFWAALTIGRLSLALPQRVEPSKLLEASCLLFVAGMALFWLLPGRLCVIGLPVAGLGSAPIFPLYVALTPGRLGESVTGKAVGYSIAGAAIGGPVAVALFGLLAGALGTGVLAPCLFGAAVVMYAAHRVLAGVVRRLEPSLAVRP